MADRSLVGEGIDFDGRRNGLAPYTERFGVLFPLCLSGSLELKKEHGRVALLLEGDGGTVHLELPIEPIEPLQFDVLCLGATPRPPCQPLSVERRGAVGVLTRTQPSEFENQPLLQASQMKLSTTKSLARALLLLLVFLTSSLLLSSLFSFS